MTDFTGNAINQPEQLNLTNSSTTINYFDNTDGDHLLATGGLYAPTIRYNNGTFFIVCTNVVRAITLNAEDSLQNFIISTTDIHANKWSNPIYFDFNGIDPSLFFNPTNGKAYICGSKSPGPSTRIMLFEIDLLTGEKMTEEKELWNGTGGIYPEGPHIYFHNDFYYLMIAEGGTHEGHSVTTARSKDIEGPYEASPENPILSASGTEEYVQCTGHCEAFEGKSGEWWGVCLGVRMGKTLLYGSGRETFLVKGRWTEEGWLVFDRARMEVDIGGVAVQEEKRLTAAEGVDLLYIRDPDLSKHDNSQAPRMFKLTSSAHDLTAPEASPTFIGKRQRRLEGTSSVVLRSSVGPINPGLAIYKDEHRFLRIYHSRTDNSINLHILNKAKHIKRSSQHAISGPFSAIKFTITYTENAYTASFQIDSQDTIELGTVDAIELSGKDFVGPIVGLFVFAQDEEHGVAEFERFVVDSVEV